MFIRYTKLPSLRMPVDEDYVTKEREFGVNAEVFLKGHWSTTIAFFSEPIQNVYYEVTYRRCRS